MKNLLILFLLLNTIGIAAAQRNVILIIADDLGSDWCGFQEDRVDTVNMPNVRKLLSNGVRFSNAWSNPVCSPTRSGIVTGRYSFRTGVGNVVIDATTTQLDVNETTIPNLLKNANAPTKYACANIGKWHLQSSAPTNYNNPGKMGWDYYAGVFTGQPVTTYYNWTKVTNGVASTSTTYATVETTNDAITWLGQQNTKPFFLWLAYNAPHTPFHLPPDSLITNHALSGTTMDINQNPKQYYKAAAEAMDNQIGKLYAWLQANNKLDNTDIIFIGDNGDPQRVAQTTNLARAKGTVYQLGVHVPFIISGPSVANPGRASDALVNVQDLFATIIELAGYTNWQTQIAANKPIDSKSLVPILKNTATEARPWAYTEIFDPSVSSETNSRAIRNATYKLIYFDSSRVQEFYNLTTDPNEATNLLMGTLTSTERTNYTYLCTEMGNLVSTTVCSPTIPVELTTFKAKLLNKTVVLNWQTASENNNKSFFIERSGDGLNFNSIGEVKGNGTSSTPHDYTFTDLTPSVKDNYYRLRQIDFDGKETLSPVVSVFLGKTSLTLKSTLVHQALDISTEEAVTFDIHNLTGQLVYHTTLKGSRQIDISHWLSGLYLIHTSTGDALKFIKE